jgi:uncharacterized membrane protein
MPTKKSSTKTENKNAIAHDDKVIAAVGYIWVLFTVPLLLKRDNTYVQHHAKQGLILFLFEVAVILLGWLPVLGWFIIMPIGMLAAIILAVLGVINALQGNLWEMPFLAKYAKKIKF